MAHFDLPLDQLESYRPEVREPSDFDEFWASTLATSRSADAVVEMGADVAGLANVEVRDVTFPGFGGDPIKAWYARPRGVEGPLPCVVEIAGYGGGRGLPIDHTLIPSAGYAHFFLDTRGQGSAWGNGGGTPDPQGHGPATPGSMTKGIEDPEQYYYRRVYTDAVRAVDAARSLEGVDATRVAFRGGSQGGGVAIAVGGLVPDLAGVLIDVPFLCHFERAIAITDAYPYQEIVKYLSVHRGAESYVLDTLSYFDGVNLAKRAASASTWSVASMDMVCPPSTGYAAYNRWGEHTGGTAARDMAVYDYNGHEGGQGHQAQRQLDFLARVFAA